MRTTRTLATTLLTAALLTGGTLTLSPDAAACRPAAEHPEKCEEVHEGWDEFGSGAYTPEPRPPRDEQQQAPKRKTPAKQAPAPKARPGNLAVTG